MQPEAQGECTQYTERYYYNAYESRCKAFVYTGCGGNQNNFLQIDDCRNKCERSFVPQPLEEEFQIGHCFLEQDAGPCNNDESMVKWSYDSRDGVCKQFRFSGCGGNGNRFQTRQECEDKCFQSQG